jgi:hypothetical protein
MFTATGGSGFVAQPERIDRIIVVTRNIDLIWFPFERQVQILNYRFLDFKGGFPIRKGLVRPISARDMTRLLSTGKGLIAS